EPDRRGYSRLSTTTRTSSRATPVDGGLAREWTRGSDSRPDPQSPSRRLPWGNSPNDAPASAQPIARASNRKAWRYFRISSARACRVASGSPASNSVMTITRWRRMRQYATDKAKWDQLQYKWEEATKRTHAPQQTTHGLHGVTESPRRRAA